LSRALDLAFPIDMRVLEVPSELMLEAPKQRPANGHGQKPAQISQSAPTKKTPPQNKTADVFEGAKLLGIIKKWAETCTKHGVISSEDEFKAQVWKRSSMTQDSMIQATSEQIQNIGNATLDYGRQLFMDHIFAELGEKVYDASEIPKMIAGMANRPDAMGLAALTNQELVAVLQLARKLPMRESDPAANEPQEEDEVDPSEDFPRD
jgi:hypothetical protein